MSGMQGDAWGGAERNVSGALWLGESQVVLLG